LTRDDALAVARIVCGGTPEQLARLPALYAGNGIESRQVVWPRRFLRDMLEGTRESGYAFLPSAAGPTTRERMALYAESAGPLALSASARALDESGLPASAVTHLITVSCTGFTAPGVDLTLVSELGLRPTVERTHVGFMGCHGALNGLRVANGFVRSGPRAVVLLCAVELCSLHCHYGWDAQRIVANALFADGAAALVLADPDRAPAGAWRLRATGSCLVPDSADALGWTIGDHGFEMTMSKRIPQLIAREVRPWLEGWLADLDLTPATVASWAIHPGGPKILSAVEEGLGLGLAVTADARGVLAHHGNMSSPTLLFIIDRLRRRRAPRPCVALGFGPGLAAESALFE
jgi:predicted naringenin-chalcone synthase